MDDLFRDDLIIISKLISLTYYKVLDWYVDYGYGNIIYLNSYYPIKDTNKKLKLILFVNKVYTEDSCLSINYNSILIRKIYNSELINLFTYVKRNLS